MKSKYNQIKNYIIDNINKGKYTSGQKIESESTLMNIFNVSRMTVRQAISELQAENILTTVKGKGTFVQIAEKINHGSFLLSTTENARINGKSVTTKVTYFTQVKADEKLATILSCEVNTILWYFKRMRYIDGLPTVFEVCHMPYDIAPNLSLNVLENSLFDYLESINVNIDNATVQTKAVLTDDELASELEIAKGDPIIKTEERTYDVNYKCLTYTEQFYHPVNFEETRTVIRKKMSYIKVHSTTKILLISANSDTDTSVIGEMFYSKLKNDIKNQNLNIQFDMTQYRKLKNVKETYDIILLEPRLKVYKDEMAKHFSKSMVKCIHTTEYGALDTAKVISETINEYNKFKANL